MDMHRLRVMEFDTSVSGKGGEKKYIAQHEEYKQEDWKTSTDETSKDETGDENHCLNDNTSPPGLSKKGDKICPPGTSKKYLVDTSSPPGTSKKSPDDKRCLPGTSEKYLDDTTSTSPPETSKKYNFARSKSRSEIFKIPPKIKPRKRDLKINSSHIGLTKLFQDSAYSHQKNRTFNLRKRNSRVHHKIENVKEKNEEVHFLFARETPSFIKYCKKRAKNERTTLKKKPDSELPNDLYGFQKTNRCTYDQYRTTCFSFINKDKIPFKKLRRGLHRKRTSQQVARNCVCKHHGMKVLNSARELSKTPSIYYHLTTAHKKRESDQEKGFGRKSSHSMTKDEIVEVSSSSLGPVPKSCRDAGIGSSNVELFAVCRRSPPNIREKFLSLEDVSITSEYKLQPSPLPCTPKPGAAPTQNKCKRKFNKQKKTKLTSNVPLGLISRFAMDILDFHSKKKVTGKSCIKYLVFGLLIVVWSPCLLAVILAWVVMFPVKLFTLKTDKSKRFRNKNGTRSEYQRMCFENYLPENKRSFMTSATSWYSRTVGNAVKTLTSLLKLKKKAPTGAGSSFLPTSHPNPRKRYTLFYADNRGWLMKPLRCRNTQSSAYTRVVESMPCGIRQKFGCLKTLRQKSKKVSYACPIHGHKSSKGPLTVTRPWQCLCKRSASCMLKRLSSRHQRRQQVNIPPTFTYPTSGIALNSADKIINAKQFNSNDIANNIAHKDLAKYHLGQRKNGTLPFGIVLNYPRGTKHPLMITNLQTFRAHNFGLAGKTLNMSTKCTPRLVIKGLQGQLPKCWTKHEAGKAVKTTPSVRRITSFIGVPKDISSYRQNTKRKEALESPSGRNHKAAINNKKLHTLQKNHNFRNKRVLADIPQSTRTKQANTSTYNKINYAHKTQNTSKHILYHKVTNKQKEAEKAKPNMPSKCARHAQPKQAYKYKTRIPTQKHSNPAKIKSSLEPDTVLNSSVRKKHKQSEQGYKYNPDQITRSTNGDIPLNYPCGEKHKQSTQANKYKLHQVSVATQKQSKKADITTSTNVNKALYYPYGAKHKQSKRANKYKPYQVPLAIQKQLDKADITTSTNVNIALNYPYGEKHKQSERANTYKPNQVPVAIQRQSNKADITTSTNVDIALNSPWGEKHKQSKYGKKHQPHQIPNATQMHSTTADNTTLTNHDLAFNYLGAVKPSTANKKTLCISSTVDKDTICTQKNYSPDYVSKKQDISIQKLASKVETSVHCASDSERSKTKELVRPEQTVLPKQVYKYKPYKSTIPIQKQRSTADIMTSTNRDVASNYLDSVKPSTANKEILCNSTADKDTICTQKISSPDYVSKKQDISVQKLASKIETSVHCASDSERSKTKELVRPEQTVLPKQVYKYKPYKSTIPIQKQRSTADIMTSTNRDVALNYLDAVKPNTANKEILCFPSTADKDTICTQKIYSPDYVSKKQDISVQKLASKIETSVHCASDSERSKTKDLVRPEQTVLPKQAYKYKSTIPIQKQRSTADIMTSTNRDVALNYLEAVKPSTANKEILCIPSTADKDTICTQKTISPEYVSKKQDISIQKQTSKIDISVDCTSCYASASREKTGSLQQTTSLKTGTAWDGELGESRKLNDPYLYEGTQTIASLISQENEGKVETDRPKRAFTKKMVDCGYWAKPKSIATATEFPSERQAFTQYPSKQQTLAIDCGLATEQNLNTYVRESFSTSRSILANRTENNPTKQPLSQNPSLVGRTLQISRVSTTQPLSTRQLQTDELLKQFQPHANSLLLGMSSDCRYGLAPQIIQVSSVQASSSQFKIAKDCKCGATPQQKEPDKQMEKIATDSKKTKIHEISSAKEPPSQQPRLTQPPSHTKESLTKTLANHPSTSGDKLTPHSHQNDSVDKALGKITIKETKTPALKKSSIKLPKSSDPSPYLLTSSPTQPDKDSRKTLIVTETPPTISSNIPELPCDCTCECNSEWRPKSNFQQHLPDSLHRSSQLNHTSQATSPVFGIASDCPCFVTPQQNEPDKQMNQVETYSKKTNTHITSSAKAPPSQQSKLTQAPPSHQSKLTQAPPSHQSKLTQAPSHTLQEQPKFGIASDCLCGTVTGSKSQTAKETQTKSPPVLKKSSISPLPTSLPHKCPCPIATLQNPVGEQPHGTKVSTTSQFPKSPDHSPLPKSLPRKCQCPVETRLPQSLPRKCRCPVEIQQDPVGEQPYGTKVSTTSSERNIVKVDKTRSRFPKSPDHSPLPKSLPRKCRCPVETRLPKSLPRKCRCPVETLQDPVGEQPYGTKVSTTCSKRNVVKIDKTRSKSPKSPDHSPHSKSSKCRCPVEGLQDPTGEQPYYTKRSTTCFKRNCDHSSLPKSFPRKCQCPVDTLQGPVSEQPRNVLKIDKTRSRFSNFESLQNSESKKTSQRSRKSIFSRKSLDFQHECPCPSSDNNIDKRCYESDKTVLRTQDTRQFSIRSCERTEGTCSVNEPSSRVQYRSKVSRLVMSLRSKLFSRKISKQTKIPENAAEKPRPVTFSSMQVNHKKINKSHNMFHNSCSCVIQPSFSRQCTKKTRSIRKPLLVDTSYSCLRVSKTSQRPSFLSHSSKLECRGHTDNTSSLRLSKISCYSYPRLSQRIRRQRSKTSENSSIVMTQTPIECLSDETFPTSKDGSHQILKNLFKRNTHSKLQHLPSQRNRSQEALSETQSILTQFLSLSQTILPEMCRCAAKHLGKTTSRQSNSRPQQLRNHQHFNRSQKPILAQKQFSKKFDPQYSSSLNNYQSMQTAKQTVPSQHPLSPLKSKCSSLFNRSQSKPLVEKIGSITDKISSNSRKNKQENTLSTGDAQTALIFPSECGCWPKKLHQFSKKLSQLSRKSVEKISPSETPNQVLSAQPMPRDKTSRKNKREKTPSKPPFHLLSAQSTQPHKNSNKTRVATVAQAENPQHFSIRQPKVSNQPRHPEFSQHLHSVRAQPNVPKIDHLRRSSHSKQITEKVEKQDVIPQQAEAQQGIPIIPGKCRCAEQTVKTEHSSNKKSQQIQPSHSLNSHSLPTQRFQSPTALHPTRKSTLGTGKQPELSQHISNVLDNSKIDSLHRSFQSKQLTEKVEKQFDAIPRQAEAEQVIPILPGKCRCAEEQQVRTQHSSNNKLLRIQPLHSPNSQNLRTDNQRFKSSTASHPTRKSTLGTHKQHELSQHISSVQPDNSKIDSLHRSFQSEQLTEKVEEQFDAIPRQAEAEQVIPILPGKCRCAEEQQVRTQHSSNNKLLRIQPLHSPNSQNLRTDYQRFQSPTASHPTRKSTIGTHKQHEFSQHISSVQPDNSKIDSLHRSFQSKQLTEKVEEQFDAIPRQAEAEQVIPILPGKCRCAEEQVNTQHSSNNKLLRIQPLHSPNSQNLRTDNQRFQSTASHPTRKSTLGTHKQHEFSQHLPNQPLETPASKLSQPHPSQQADIPYSAPLHNSQSKRKKPCKCRISKHGNEQEISKSLHKIAKAQSLGMSHYSSEKALLHNSQPKRKKPCKCRISKHGNEQEISKSFHKIAKAQSPGMSHYSSEKFKKSQLISGVYPVTAKKKRLRQHIILQQPEISLSSGNPQFQPNPKILVYQQNLQYQKRLSQIPTNLDKPAPGFFPQYTPGLRRTGKAAGEVQEPYPDFNRVSMCYPGHYPPRQQSEPIPGPNGQSRTNNYPPAPGAAPPPIYTCDPCYTNQADTCATPSPYDESALRRAYKRRPLRYTPPRQQLPRVVMEKKLKEIKEKKKKAAAHKQRKAGKWSRIKEFFKCLRDSIKQSERETWPTNIQCRPMWLNALKRRPCFWIYKMGPRIYRIFLNFHKYQQYFGQICVYFLTLCFWSPLLFCGYFCCKSCC